MLVMLWWLLLMPPASAIYVGWPMNEQLPNVARVNNAYLFQLANITYRSSDGGLVTYSASNLPLWLSFDSLSRTFSGTPAESDVGEFSISLAGSDSADNSNINNTYTMMVSNSSGLRLSSSDVMFTEIAKYGQTNGVNGLVVKEGEQFSIEFSSLVFVENSDATRPIDYFYGRSSDRTSLPNWIKFDSDTYTFLGTVPYVTSDIAPSVLYGFSFIGSDYQGYTGAEGLFYLVVGAHQLSTLLNETIKINGTYDSEFDYTVPVLSDVYLDSSVIELANISSVYADDLPLYMLFDDTDYALTGTFPNKTTFDNFTIVVEDVYGNTVDLPYSFSSIGSVFTVKSIADVNATRGEWFEYQLLRSDFTDFNGTTVGVSFNSSSWLSYDSLNLTILGDAPKDLDAVKVTVKADSSFDSESRSFNIVGVKKSVNPTLSLSLSSASATSSSTSSSTGSSGSSSTTTAAAQKKSSSDHHKLVLGLAIGLPLLAALVAAIILLFCCCRRRKNADAESEKHAEPELTGPGFGTTYDMDDHTEHAKQLGALNALKLDNDASSTLSSMTHVDSDAESRYFDASEKPVKSWRANDTSDSNAIKQSFLLLQRHTSQLSMDTVNTEQLFSVRLVDDNSGRNSTQSAILNSILDPVLQREYLSGNVQRLDSDGNITESRGRSVSPAPRTLRPTSTNLNNIEEEDSSNNTFYNTSTESSNYNLMAKFLSEGGLSPSDNDAATHLSLEEDFEPVKSSMGTVEWRRSQDALVPSPDSETFLLHPDLTPVKPAAAATTAYYNKNQSRTSISSESDSKALHDGKKGTKAKLVDFTRKGSLRDAARHHKNEHPGETAQFHDGDSD